MQVRALCEMLWSERSLTNAVIEGFALFALDSGGLTRWFPDMRELAASLGYRVCAVRGLSEVAVYVGGTIYYRASLTGTDLQWAVAHELSHALLDDYCADEYQHADVQALTMALFFTSDHLRYFNARGGVTQAIAAGSRRCRAWVIRLRWTLLRSSDAIAA